MLIITFFVPAYLDSGPVLLYTVFQRIVPVLKEFTCLVHCIL